MRSYVALSGRYLKQQKRRTLLTIIGIILSVALIGAIGTMGQAIKDNMISNAKYEDGSFHFGYLTADMMLAEQLRNNVLVDQLGGMLQGPETKLSENASAYIHGVNADGFDLLPIHLEQGRYPQSDRELVVEQWLLEGLQGQPALGGKLTLNDIEGKPREYTIVGILKNQRKSQIEQASKVFSLLDENAESTKSATNLQLFVTLKPGVEIKDELVHFERLDDKFETNRELLALMGQSADNSLNKALLIIFGTLIGLVVLSTIAVIYNAFHIAVLERIRQFGLLRTLGATPRQIRNLVLREATMLSLIAIPLGLAVGWGGLWLALWLMIKNGFQVLQMESFKLTFHWWIMGLSVGVGLFAVFVAAWLPARKASTVSPVEAAKGAGSIVRESYRRMRIPSLLQLIGVEGKMASSNIRRNRAKFRITTFSIAISITLFIVFHYFTQQSLNLSVDTTENTKIAFEVYPYSGGFEENRTSSIPEDLDRLSAEQMEQLRSIQGVDEVYGMYGSFGTETWVPQEFANERYLDKIDFAPPTQPDENGERYGISTEFRIYDEARFQEAKPYLVAGTADPDRLAAEDAVLVIQTVKPFVLQSNKREQLEITRYKVGDTLSLRTNPGEDAAPIMREVKIGGILSQSPFDSPYAESVLVAIGTRSTITKLYQAAFPDEGNPNFLLTSAQISIKDGADAEAIKSELESFISRSFPGGAQLVDIASERQRERQFALQMQIFVYGFLIIIGTIGSLNIINTVQTNLLLRRKEIGLLQSVGMTLGQVRRMASAEGVWFGVIGGFWGIGLGAAISYLLYKQINDVQGIPFVFPWSGALIATACAIAVGLLSVQSPLRRMNKASLIDRLREE
ncbi:ABC transporter permease [Cohnella panacarvi]|uniref:ABC transporter permease n=1 Tax=Cohnella panacarvi TaxID=400776 RepID=UPI00047E5F55|nr:ABC transporter permease [Cohnella panacarvi]